MSATMISPFQIPPASIRIQGIFQLTLSCQNDGVLTGLPQKKGVSTMEPNGITVFKMVLQIVFHTLFSHLPGGLERFADSSNIPYNQPTIFHPSRIATVKRTFLL